MDFIHTLGNNIQNNWLSIILLITAISFNIVVLYSKLNGKPKGKKALQLKDEIANITRYIIEAEKILGNGQGNAKLNYVLNKIGTTPKDTKTIKKIENTLTTLKEAKKIITETETNKQTGKE